MKPRIANGRLTIPEVRKWKEKEPLVCLTAYTTPIASIADQHCDILLVGDSVGMVLHGLPSTIGVTLDMMVLHAKAVMRGAQHALVVVDLPFGAYEGGVEAAFMSASHIMKETNADAIKLEGGRHMAETIHFLTQRGIPVIGHIGLTPQAIHVLGGYRLQGCGEASTNIIQDAEAVAKAGAFAIVLEKIPENLARNITTILSIPTIGIGASPACDGQILVSEDILGFFDAFQPSFVQRYAELGKTAELAIKNYASDVRARRFPSAEHIFIDKSSQLTTDNNQCS